MTDPVSTIDFRKLAHDDVPLLHRWMSAPHAVRWFGERTLEDVAAEYADYIDGVEKIHAYLVLEDGEPVGMMTWEYFADYPELARLYGIDEPGATNCDVIVGDVARCRRGLGPRIVRAFLERIVFADPRTTCCVIDPHTENGVAIRAYEKVGFTFLHVAPDDGDGAAVYLMRLAREGLAAPFVQRTPYLRLARPDELAIARAIDDDATDAYARIGIALLLPHDHPFARDEEARWSAAIARGHLLFACAADGTPLGFVAFGLVDGRPFLHQISVRCSAARQGIGTMLVDRLKRWSLAAGELWLTTYGSVVFNAPWYARLGFERVDATQVGPELGAILEKERILPHPEDRVVMRFVHGPR